MAKLARYEVTYPNGTTLVKQLSEGDAERLGSKEGVTVARRVDVAPEEAVGELKAGETPAGLDAEPIAAEEVEPVEEPSTAEAEASAEQPAEEGGEKQAEPVEDKQAEESDNKRRRIGRNKKG